MARILIIEDDVTFTHILEGFLKKHGHEVVVTHKVKDGIKTLQQEDFAIALIDYRLPDGTGMDVLESIHKDDTQLQVVIMTSFHDIRTAVRAMRMGAYDYITKPVNPDELLMVLQEALRKNTPESKQPAATNISFVEGTSEMARQLYQHIQLVAPTDLSVIIQGESGTGKEQAAQNIHRLSKRAGKPFIAIDCGALSPDLAASELFGHVKGAFTGALQDKQGQFEAANGGTLFLDEIGNLSYEVQVKLLRALQEREIQPLGSNKQIKVNVRIITATNDDLLVSVRNGKFREDLYHRLNEFKIKLPALQQRREDLDLFIDYFIELANKELGKKIRKLSDEVRELFSKYDWPGNLRELKNIIKRSVLLATGDAIEMNNLPDEMVMSIQSNLQSGVPDLKSLQSANEKELIIKTLKDVKYNKSKAARLLNIDRTTLYYKMSKYNIDG